MTIDLATAKMLFEQNRLRELLQVPANAHGKELEQACRCARVRHHPDKGGNHEVASIINAAADKLLQGVLPGTASEPTCTWKFTYMGGVRFVNKSGYETKLRRECEILASGLRKAKECLENCGYGSQRPPCTETCDCQCTGHNAQRLRDQVESLDVLMPWAEDAVRDANNASNVGSDKELNLMDKLRDLLTKAKDIKHKCSARASLFDALSSMPRQKKQRQDERQGPQTTTSMDSVSSTIPEQLPQDAGTEQRVEEQRQEDTTHAEDNAPTWRCCIESCSRAESSTFHIIMNYIAKAFGKEALEEANHLYKLKVICWYGGTRRVMVDLEGHFVRLRRTI